MNRRGLPGVFFRPVVFEPTFHKHARQTCGGCQIHVLDRSAFVEVPASKADEVVDALQRTKLRNKKVKVQIARPRE